MPNPDAEFALRITGMDCAGCAHSLQAGVSQLEGVTSCDLNFATEELRVVGDVTRAAVADRVRELGYDVAERESPFDSGAAEPPTLGFIQYMGQRPETRLALLGAVLVLPGVLLSELGGLHHPAIDLASIGALLAAGLPIARSAWRTLKVSRDININVLMTIAAVGAVFIGAFTEAGMVMVLFAIGEALEGYTAGRARNAIRSLMQVVPNEARRLEQHGDGLHEQRVSVDDLRIGDVIVVRPGERIPMDGRVVSGASFVNQAPITGEGRTLLRGARNGL